MAALRFAVLVALALLGRAAPTQDAPPARPRLVVLLALDQLVPEQLERLEPWLEGGLGRFAREGRVYRRAAHLHGVSETAPGHASVATGCHPSRHGVVANDWLTEEGSAYCFRDEDALPVTSAGVRGERGYAEWRVSPRNLRAPGIAEHLRAAWPLSRSIAIAGKDRGAIGLSGRADLALWWDRQEGGFLSSSWYGERLPEWVLEWNAGWVERLRASELRDGWTSSLPEDFAASGTAPDERPGEGGLGGRATFPYHVERMGEAAALPRVVWSSPAQDLLAVDLARAAVAALELGADEHVDLLALSLSACDVLGHELGPRSAEVTDLVLRADRALDALFDELDARLGRDGWIAALSADHGVLELPEELAARGIDARRVEGRVFRELLASARAELEARYGLDVVAAAGSREVRLARARIAAAGHDLEEVRAACAEALERHGGAWVAHAWTWDELQRVAAGGALPDVPGAPLLALEARSFDAERAPDVTLTPHPWRVMRRTGTTHGTPHRYDRAVPLAFLGPGFAPGASFEPAAPVDALPTLFDRLGLPVPPDLDGRVLR